MRYIKILFFIIPEYDCWCTTSGFGYSFLFVVVSFIHTPYKLEKKKLNKKDRVII